MANPRYENNNSERIEKLITRLKKERKVANRELEQNREEIQNLYKENQKLKKENQMLREKLKESLKKNQELLELSLNTTKSRIVILPPTPEITTEESKSVDPQSTNPGSYSLFNPFSWGGKTNAKGETPEPTASTNKVR